MGILLDKELGAKLRALITVIFGLITALIAVLQALASVLELLPHWQSIGATLLFIQGVITFLGRFTSIGNVSK